MASVQWILYTVRYIAVNLECVLVQSGHKRSKYSRCIHDQYNFTNLYHMSCVTCHLSCVTCHVSPLTCNQAPVACHLPSKLYPKDPPIVPYPLASWKCSHALMSWTWNFLTEWQPDLDSYSVLKSRIRETKHLSTDAYSSTDAIGGWSKNTQKPDFFEKWKKSPKNAKMSRNMPKLVLRPLTRGL